MCQIPQTSVDLSQEQPSTPPNLSNQTSSTPAKKRPHACINDIVECEKEMRDQNPLSLNHDEILKATQSVLQSACKRRRVSSSGSKEMLVERLRNAGVIDLEQIEQLAIEYVREGPDEALRVSGKQKSPNWTENESARLCHITADPKHATVLGRLYNKFANRAELEIGKHDPWAAEFVEMFNNNDYEPNIPDGRNGVTDDLLLSFDPCMHPFKRTGACLKQRWNKLRSKYTVAREKFTRSGQGEHDNFDLFTDGDDSLAYMHCVFHGLPSLDAIVRSIPDVAAIEAGIENMEEGHSFAKSENSKRNKKATADHAVVQGLIGLANSMSAPVNINPNEGAVKNDSSERFIDFDISDRVAGTVEKLMNLESNILEKRRDAEDSGNQSFARILSERSEQVRKRIEKALFTE